MGIVWHGNYAKFFEDGREDFGKHYGISYLNVYSNKYIIETRYIDHDAAKIHFEYTIYNKKTNKVCATGESIQVFIDLNRELMLTPPTFFMEWKKKMGLID